MKREAYDIPPGGLHPLRAGRVTASRAAKMFSKPATASYQGLINELVVERLTGESAGLGFTSAAMERGTELEPLAAAAYEAETFAAVQPGGFHTAGEWLAASPDGLIGDDGILEIKCPLPHNHIDYLRRGVVPSTYRWQVRLQLFCTDRAWCDFVSFCPDLPLMVVHVERDPEMDKQILKAAEQVGAEVSKIMTDLQQ